MLVHQGTREISTHRLRLRPYRISDAANMYQNYACDARVAKFLSWEAYRDIEPLKAFLEDCLSRYEKSDYYHWAIEYAGQVIGGISAYRISEKNESCEVGYCIGCDFWGKGIMPEALSAVLDFLFQAAGFHRVFAEHDVENPASGSVMRKCGMVYEGRLRGHYRRHDGTYSDAMLYGKLAGE